MQYADEAVVVINLKPVKASNGVENKTDAKGWRDFKECQEV